MATNEELIKAAQVIKEFCGIDGNCGERGCPFCDRGGNCCISSDRSVSTVYPADWEIPKPRRWTDTDILWAKVAKESGVFEIIRQGNCNFAVTYIGEYVRFPNSAFAELEIDEHIRIDEILEEEDNNE